MDKPYFIAIEGIEGVGKTTLTQEVIKYFDQKNISCRLTREPGGTQLSEKLRTILKDKENDIDPITELLLMFASRSHHVNHHIKPLLKKGISVVSDRYVAASYAYQGAGRGIDLQYIKNLDQMACGDVQPDYTILITCPVDVAISRVNSRNEEIDRFEEENKSFFERVQQGYLTLAENNDRYIVINSDQSLKDTVKKLRKILDDILC
jgi:dTMP kinase